MVKPRFEGGLGITNYRQLQLVVCLSRTAILWNANSIWTSWIEQRYIYGRALWDISMKATDSTMWKSILKERENIAKCLEYGDEGSFAWKGRGQNLSFKNI